METSLLEELLARAFQEGFSASAEGFNGECAFDHLSPHNQTLDKTEKECVARLVDEAAKAQWIAVSERLPEPYQHVIGWRRGWVRSGDVWLNDEEEWLTGDSEPAGDISHWMHLPEPPEVK